MENERIGTLYVVGTPIGNLEDITLRALRILQEVDIIAAEDTRRTRKLLAAYNIHTPLTSYFAHNEARKTQYLLDRLKAGKSIALVSNAGTPGISDPGYRLLRAAREAGVPIIPVPGASAVVAALSISGLPADAFVFWGFLPPKAKARRERLEQILNTGLTAVIFEAPHRLLASLKDLEELCGTRQIVVARELTKKFEEVFRGTPVEIRKELAGRERIRGEFTLVIPPPDR